MNERARPSLIEVVFRTGSLAFVNLLLAAFVVFTYAGVVKATETSRFDQTTAVALTSLILLAWTGWVGLNSMWFIRNRGASWLITATAALVVLVPTIMLLAASLSLVNECSADGGFPLNSSC